MRIRIALASAALLGASVAAAQPALAVTWGSPSNSVVGYDHGVRFGKMYGRFHNDNSVSAMSTTWQYDLRPGGNTVRVETDFYWKKVCRVEDTTESWCFDVSKQTAETNTASWYRHSRARDFDSRGSAARGGINICEIKAWRNDPCSVHAYPHFSY